jgi:biofilm PGA synthesis N-glycosyltransferase PgaC
MIELYLLTFAAVSLFCQFGFWIRMQWNKNYQEKKQFYPIGEISVVIPFRNESENLPALIASLNRLTQFPKEITWVNDHSNDTFEECLAQLDVPCAVRLIHLPAHEIGKKKALRAGITSSTGRYILTWDADVTVPASYFQRLSQTPTADLLILPVSMPGKTGSQLFFELDYQYLNALNTAISGILPPIVASGANLLFNKTIFDRIDSVESHAHIASGDDVFLLQDFKAHKQQIELALHAELQVQTKVPQSWEAFFQQRLRWIGKAQHVGDTFAAAMGVIGFVYHTFFWLLFFIGASGKMLLILLICKLLFDASLLAPYLSILKRRRVIFFLPVFSVVYPFYILMILVMTMFYETSWKGRDIKFSDPDI